MGASSSAHTAEIESGFGQPEPWDSVVSLGPLFVCFWFQLPVQESLPTYSPPPEHPDRWDVVQGAEGQEWGLW